LTIDRAQNLNDMFLFAKVVEHGGYSAAAAALGMQASLLSRHISALEGRLGVRLLNRTTRRVSVTDAGLTYYGHCAAVVAEAQAAEDAIEHTRSTPQGLVRFSCPVSMLRAGVNDIVVDYLAAHPLVRIAIDATGRRVDVVEEGLDFALRVRAPPLEDSDLVVRVLRKARLVLVASPRLFDALPRPVDIEAAARLPTVAMARSGDRHSWVVQDADGAQRNIVHVPRLAVDDFSTLRLAALRGLGVALMPYEIAIGDIASGALEALLPDVIYPTGIVHAVFPSRRGLVPAVRGLLDALAAGFNTMPFTS
jgi:DNA-binding transcriptional LysR family regulator